MLSGRATLHVGGEEHELGPGIWARVGPRELRKIGTGDETARVLAIGGSPGDRLRCARVHRGGRPDPAHGPKLLLKSSSGTGRRPRPLERGGRKWPSASVTQRPAPRISACGAPESLPRTRSAARRARRRPRPRSRRASRPPG